MKAEDYARDNGNGKITITITIMMITKKMIAHLGL